jgi:hypothetical protein
MLSSAGLGTGMLLSPERQVSEDLEGATILLFGAQDVDWMLQNNTSHRLPFRMQNSFTFGPSSYDRMRWDLSKLVSFSLDIIRWHGNWCFDDAHFVFLGVERTHPQVSCLLVMSPSMSR